MGGPIGKTKQKSKTMTENLAEFLEVLKRTRFTGTPDQVLVEATNRYIDNCEAPNVEPPLLDALQTLPICGASWLAILFGARVEKGQNPTITGLRLWNTFCHHMSVLPETVDLEQDPPEPTGEQAEMLKAIPSFCQGLVAHLARMPEFVQQVSQDERTMQRIEFLESYSYGFTWVNEILHRRSGKVLLLHTESRRGWMMRYKNVANCFHLFSLIQNVASGVIPDVPSKRDPKLVEASTGGEHYVQGDQAWWHYGTAVGRKPDLSSTIFGEMYVSLIPQIDGQQIVVLWPKILEHRGWDAGFFGPQINSSKPNSEIIHELTESESNLWFSKLGI